jgi:ABC-type nitrate/sulfonate/bicarbonate transport system permease component
MSTRTQSLTTDLVPEQLYQNNKVIFVESLIFIVVAWSIISNTFNMAGTISSPSLVGAYSSELVLSGDATVHIVDTIRRVIYGFILTTIIGTFLGILLGMSDFWRDALQDYITIGLALPSLFAAIFAAMWFGISDTTPMVAGAVIAFPFLTQNVFEGVQNVDNRLLQMSSAFDVSRRRAIWRVIVQSVLPEWFAGARYSFAICWKITTLAELVAASSGVGFMIEFEMERLSITGVLAWTVMFTAIIIIVEYGILQQIEKRVFDWRESTDIGMIGGV